MTNSLKVSYDDLADVLYITSAISATTKSHEEEAGLVLRYDLATKKPIGVTVIDYRGHWLPKKSHLVDRLSTFFHVSQSDAREAIRKAA